MKRLGTTNMRMLVAFVLVGVGASSFMGWFAYSVARDSLERATRNALTTGREIKKRQIESFFANLERIAVVLANSSQGSVQLRDVSRLLGLTRIDKFACPTGNSGALPADLSRGPPEFPPSVMKPCQKSSSQEAVFVDFGQQSSDSQPSAFLSAPVVRNGGTAEIIVFTIPVTALNHIMLARESWVSEGFGRSGETYLVGSDLRMRSDSRFFVENQPSFLERLRQQGKAEKVLEAIVHGRTTICVLDVPTETAHLALSGETGTKVVADYRNIKVLSSYTPIVIHGVQWALLSEIDFEEAFSDVAALRANLFLFSAILALVFLMVGSFLAHRIATPLDKLAQKMLALSERLQQRIGQDLHDGLAQQLLGISFLCRTLDQDFSDEPSQWRAQVRRIGDLLQGAVATARDLARGLCPVGLVHQGLAHSLKALAQDTSSMLGIEVEMCDSTPSVDFKEETILNLYRFTQEAISNAVRHGGATNIIISLLVTGQIHELVISNNGKAFDPERALVDGTGIGLKTMEMRARAVGGSLGIRRAQDGRMEVRCQFSPRRTRKR